MLGRLVVDHPEEPALTDGAEANEGLVATILGLQGWPAAAESSAVARDLAVLADVIVDEPRRPSPPDPPVDGRRARARPPGQGAPVCR